MKKVITVVLAVLLLCNIMPAFAAGITCPSCGNVNPDGANFCSNCAHFLNESIECPVCKKSNTAGSNYCIYCSAKLNAEYKDPVLLYNMDTIEQTGKYTIGEADTFEINKDVMGNKYDHVIYPFREAFDDYSTESEGYGTYFINGQYTLLTGTLYLPYCSRGVSDPTVRSVFRVYGDSKLLYEAPEFITGIFEPLEIAVDITGVKMLKIEIDGVNYYCSQFLVYYLPMVCAAELTVK